MFDSFENFISTSASIFYAVVIALALAYKFFHWISSSCDVSEGDPSVGQNPTITEVDDEDVLQVTPPNVYAGFYDVYADFFWGNGSHRS